MLERAPGRPAHTLDYTPVDLLSAYTAPAAGSTPRTTSWAYDRDRALTSITRPSGALVTLEYDGAGRLLRTNAGSETRERSYSASTGKLTQIAGPGEQALAFDYDGPLMTSMTYSGPVAGSITLSYDADFRVASERVNAGAAVDFAYDDDSLLTAAGGLTLTRDLESGFITATSAGAVSATQSYDAYGALASVTVPGLFDLAYLRDDLGRIVERHEGTSTTTYGYDLAGRLASVDVDGVLTEYAYDANGNRITVGDVSCTYDDQDRLVSCGDVVYAFTDDGELLSATDTISGDTTTYGYDALGNLRRVDLPDGTVIEYLVDGLNRRVGKLVDGVLSRQWLWSDGLRVAAELDGAGAVIARFVYATRVNVPDLVIKGGVTYRVIHDHLGSPMLVVNTGDGSVVQARRYDAWGGTIVDTHPGFMPFGFAGGLADVDTGLVRFGARDYDPETGRWTARDPILFGGGDPNLYGYVLGDPVNGLDPAGLQASGALAGAAAAGTAEVTYMVTGEMIVGSVALLPLSLLGLSAGLAMLPLLIPGDIPAPEGLPSSDDEVCEDETPDERRVRCNAEALAAFDNCMAVHQDTWLCLDVEHRVFMRCMNQP